MSASTSTPPMMPSKIATGAAQSRRDTQTSSSSHGRSHSRSHSLAQGYNSSGTGQAPDGIDHDEEPIKFVLLAEFDIDAGATLAQQYPFPTGTDEHTLAELMLPDGAHLRSEDWTIFYLNQTPLNAVAPVLATETSLTSPSSGRGKLSAADGGLELLTDDQEGKNGAIGEGAAQGSAVGPLLYVLNCVRMKEDKSVRRGALVKALAICTTNPYIQVYKPLLLLALDEYFAAPHPSVLARLFDALNAIPVRGCPVLSRDEKLILRASERTDLFEDRFLRTADNAGTVDVDDIGEMLDGASLERHSTETGEAPAGNTSSLGHGLPKSASSHTGPPPDWLQQSEDGTPNHKTKTSIAGRLRKSSRVSLRDSESSRSSPSSQGIHPSASQPGSNNGHYTVGLGRPRVVTKTSGPIQQTRRDTHFFDTSAKFRGLNIPIRIPLSIFEEEVGEYSLINLVQTFAPANFTPFPGPFHPHLHTSGAATHPIILILNALLTQKRIIFLGHGLPAGHVANLVLAACALPGPALRGFTERAFPYSNLAGLDILEEVPGFVAGVTNPRFEDLHSRWDILCNIETGKITVSKDIGKAETLSMHSSNQSLSSLGHQSLSGNRTEDEAPLGNSNPALRENRSDGKGETSDSLFVDEIMSAINAHQGETVIRAKFADYVNRFIRLAARYEQDNVGSTKIGYVSRVVATNTLGSGMTFADEATKSKEMALNAQRIEGWRRSKSYAYWRIDFQAELQDRAIQGFDLQHQLARLRNASNMSEAEAEMIYRQMGAAVQTYEQMTELLAHLPAHRGGLMPIALGLFHRSEAARNATVDLLNRLQTTAIGHQMLGSLNMFQRLAWQRLAEDRLQAGQAA